MQSGSPKDLGVHQSTESVEDSQDSPGHDLRVGSRQSSSGLGRREKTKRPRTTYNIARPPPSGGTVSKIPLRPKVLLQLQKVAPNIRSVPAFEVLSAAAFAFKTGRTISSLCRGRTRIRPEDLIVLQDQDYPSNIASPIEPKKRNSQHIVGVICRRKGEGKGSSPHTEICLEDGTMWEASAMSNGGYEFVSHQEHGLISTSRWVRKQSAILNNKSSAPSANTAEQKLEDRAFIFTKITPNMRQHPIVGSISRAKLDVYQHYNVPQVPSVDRIPGSARPARPSRYSSSTSFGDLEDVGGSPPIVTESSLHDLILVSGIWVAFREGWSNTFRYDEERGHGSRPSSPPYRQLHRRYYSHQTLSTSSESGVPQASSNETRGKIGVKQKLVRTGNRLLHRHPTSDVLPSTTPINGTTTFPPARRSASTAAAFIKKINRNSNGVKPAIDPWPPKFVQPSVIGLGIEGNETTASPVHYHTTPQPIFEHHRSFSIDYDTCFEDPHKDSKDVHVDVHDKRLSRTTEEARTVDGPSTSVESYAIHEGPGSESSILYKHLKDMFTAFKRSSGIA